MARKPSRLPNVLPLQLNKNMTTQPSSNEQFEEGEFVTQNSTPSTPSKAATTNTIASPSQAPTPSLEKIDIATLAGLKPNTTAPLSVIDPDALTVDESRTKLPIYKQAIFKVAVIGSCFGFVTMFVMKMMFPPEAAPVATTPIKQAEAKLTGAEFAPDPKIGILSSKVAIKEQNDGIIAARAAQQAAARDAAARNNAANSLGVRPATAATAPVANQNATPPLLTSNRPQPIPTYQPRRTIALRPQARPVPPTRPLQTAVQPSQSRPIKIVRVVVAAKPLVQKVAVAPKPSVRRAIALAKPPVQVSRIAPGAIPVPLSKPEPLTWEMANENAVGVWGRSNKVNPAKPETSAVVTSNTTMQALQSPTADGVPAPVATIGQQIRAKTIIPYQVANTTKTQSLVFSLSSALVDTNGAAMLPAGSQILADVSTLDNGAMQIDNAKAIVNGQAVDLPKQSLILQNASKQPLTAQAQDSGNNNGLGRTLAMMGMGAAQAIGQNMIQSSTNIISNGTTIQSSNSPNLVGAALYGGLNPVLNQMQAQNQANLTQPTQTSRIWFLPNGTEVNLVVALPFHL